MSENENIKFGDYVLIEQKRFGVPNEMFVYKVIGNLRSNSHVDIPVEVALEKNIIHENMISVVACIQCGVEETEVLKYPLSDVTKSESQKLIETFGAIIHE